MHFPSFTETKDIKGWAAALVLVFFIGLGYFNAPKGDFIWDDRGLIFGDWAVQKGSVFKYLEPSYLSTIAPADRGRFRPLRAFFFSLDYKLYGDHPAGYHLTNLAFHFGCSLLLFFVAGKLGLSGPEALAAAVLFAVHPAHTESVTWIKNRSDLIATFFVLASFYAFLTRRLAVSLLLFLPALLAKEISLGYPFILGLYMVCREKSRALPDYAKRMLPFAVLAVLFLVLTSLFWRKEAEGGIFTPDAQDHFQMVLVSLGFYVKLLFAPWPLKAEHPLEPIFLWSDPYLLSGAFIFAVLGALWFKFRDRDYSFYGLAIFFGLLPVLNFHYLSSRLIAEQRVYLASAFFCLLAASVLGRAARRVGAKPVLAGTAVLVLCFTGMTYARNMVWMSNVSFWQDTVKQTPSNYRANLNLAGEYQLQGDYENAYKYAKKASEGWDAPNVFYTLGFISDKLGKTDEAIDYYEKCMSYGGDRNPDVYNNLGIAYSKKGDGKKAEENFKKALQASPSYAPAYFNLAAYYGKKGEAGLARDYELRGRGLKK